MDSIITNWSKAKVRRIELRLDVERKSYDKALKILRKELPKLDFISGNTVVDVLENGYRTDFYSKTQMGSISINIWTDSSVFWAKLRFTLDHIDKLMTKNKIVYYNLVKE